MPKSSDQQESNESKETKFPEEIYTTICQNIREKRESLGLNQSDLADLLKLHPSAISKLEKGVTSFEQNVIYLFLIAEKFQVSMDWFFHENTKLLIEKIPNYPDIFNLLPTQVRDNVCLQQEAVGSISSSQLSALLEIFKNNPWGKMRGMVASIFPLLRDTWASLRVVDEMERILLPNQGEEKLRYHTRLLAAEVLSAFIWSSDGHELSDRGKNIQAKIELCVIDIKDSKDFESLFWLMALSSLRVKNISASKMDGFYHLIKNQIEINVTVYNLIFAHQWGAFYKKDKSQPGAVLEKCLNMISTTTSPSSSAYDFSLKVWAQSLKTLYYPDRDDWLDSILKNVIYQNLSENQKGSIFIISLCSSIDELDNLEKGGKDKSDIISRQKNRIRKLYDDFTIVYNSISSPFIKFWGLQTLLFLRLQQVDNSRFQDLSIQENLDNVFNDIHFIFKSSPNPLEKALALDFILSSRNPTHIKKALQATFDLIDNNPHDQLLLSLLIDVFGRIDLEIITNNNPQQQDPKFAEFYKDPLGACHLCDEYLYLGNFSRLTNQSI
jgi:transcriptional regulator with XRE-family HTH domain